MATSPDFIGSWNFCFNKKVLLKKSPATIGKRKRKRKIKIKIKRKIVNIVKDDVIKVKK